MTSVVTPAPPVPVTPTAPGRRRSVRAIVRMIWSSPAGKAGACILIGFSAVAIFAPFLAPYDPTARVAASFTHPNGQHWLGTNDIGQDILSELVHGARISLGVAVLVSCIGTAVACLVGIPAGYSRGRWGAVLMRFVDVILVLPFLPLLLLVAALFGPRLHTQILVIGLLLWARPARVLRAATLAVRSAGHIEAAVWMGGSSAYIIRRHVIPRIAPIIVAEFVRVANVAILLEASLAFLGLGDPVAKSWGTMLHYAYARAAFLTGAWLWWVVPPGLCIAAVVMGFALLGYSLEQGTDPRLRRKGWLGTS